MRFADPKVLLLLLLVPLLLGLHAAAPGRRRDRLSDERRSSGSWRLRSRSACTAPCRGCALSCSASRCSRWPGRSGASRPPASRREGIAIALVIDTSSSMSAIDLRLGDRPSSRLEVVKATLRDFVTGSRRSSSGGRGGDAIGMVTFARYADTISPPTLDHEALLGLLDQVASSRVPTEDGTAIGDAVVRAIDMLEQAEGASKVIILLTDGSYNAGEVEPLVAAQLAAAYGIRINAIGAGSRGTALMPVAAPATAAPSTVLGGDDRRGDARADRRS